MKVTYSSNNSGGSWWLTDENWRDLEQAGWVVEWGGSWFCKSRYGSISGSQRPRSLTVECESSDVCKGHRCYESYADAVENESRWLGALAREAYREGLSLRDAVAEWERVTGKDSTDAGCACCGQPHYFTAYDDNGKWVDSGPSAEYRASWGDD